MNNTAFKYPIQPDSKGNVVYVDQAKAIQQSIASILGTPKGSRFFLENYGSDVSLLAFEPNDIILQSLLTHFVAEALAEWEKRIKLKNIEFEKVGESRINVIITYRIVKKNVIDWFVYPFYKELKH